MAPAWHLSHLPSANSTSITSVCHQPTPRKSCWAGLFEVMLSGSWRRSVGHQQTGEAPAESSRGIAVCRVPSRTVVLEAQYDYNYRGNDGRQICIREGERFILLKKTNADWWQVRSEFILCFHYVYGILHLRLSIMSSNLFFFFNFENCWQVRRIGAASKAKPLYVPATYVTEVPIAPIPSPTHRVMSASLNSNLRMQPSVSLSSSPTTTCNQQHQGEVFVVCKHA